MNVLKVEKLNLYIDNKQILKNISFDLWEGYIHAIVGSNGAGKSSLSSTIMGLSGYENITGNIYFYGKKINNLSISQRAKLGITYGWQEPARFDGSLSIKKFLTAGAKNKDLDNIKNALNTVRLDPSKYLYRNVDKTLSGGERKKVELASILLMEPKLVILDEPDSGIDLESIESIFRVINILKEKTKATVILVTHSLDVLKKTDHAFLMCGGEIIEKGETEKIVPYFMNECIPCQHKNHPDKEEKR